MQPILNKRANNKLRSLVRKKNAHDATFYLIEKFGDHPVFRVQDSILLELVDTLESLYHEEDRVYYCQMAIPYLQRKINDYYETRDKYAKVLSKLSRPSNNPLWTKNARKEAGYTPECIQSTLERLDAKYLYAQYDTGYYYEQYLMWEWLLSQFNYYISVTT